MKGCLYKTPALQELETKPFRCGIHGGIRTHIPLHITDFESVASNISIWGSLKVNIHGL